MLEELKKKLLKLRADADAKLASVKDDTAPADAKRAEEEHKTLLAEAAEVEAEIKRLEESAAGQGSAPAAPAPAAQSADAEAIRAQAQKDERDRVSAITDLAKRFGQADLAAEHIRLGTKVENFRAKLLDKLAAESDRSPTNGNVRVEGLDGKESERRAAAVENALLHRFDPRGFQLTEQGREWRGMSLMEMGRAFLEAQGLRTRGLSRPEIAGLMLTRAGGMMSTSDFPAILANVANKTLRQAYEAAPQTFRLIVRVTTVPDFKEVSRVQLGEAPQLEKVNEHGEFKRGRMGEAAEKYAVATYGKVVAITRQVIINDDLNAFTRIPQAFGVQAANLESDLVWGQITANPAMADGVVLFHADHGNLANPGAAISVDTVSAGRVAMAGQTGVDGKTKMNLDPAAFLVPKALQTKAEQFVGQIFAAKTADKVPESLTRLAIVAEARLDAASATSWYLAASVTQVDIIELAYLEGAQGVYTETRMGFDVDGVEVKVRMDVGAKVIDWRGLYKNPA
jgi:phage major head subunit gpT-like protein